ncbi:hypothetical protein PUN28_016427 [Cardiocondyla obscurior]|uniref:Uncharacterized protein n=1 Tax=Cardiocondyla obscurior TaxID=286306 RepID=A0AAW2EQS1_9HYME
MEAEVSIRNTIMVIFEDGDGGRSGGNNHNDSDGDGGGGGRGGDGSGGDDDDDGDETRIALARRNVLVARLLTGEHRDAGPVLSRSDPLELAS